MVVPTPSNDALDKIPKLPFLSRTSCSLSLEYFDGMSKNQQQGVRAGACLQTAKNTRIRSKKEGSSALDERNPVAHRWKGVVQSEIGCR